MCSGGLGRTWDTKRPKVMALILGFVGGVSLIICSIVFATRQGEEVPVWYNIPLCETQQKGLFVSRDTGVGGCPSKGDLTPDWASAESVEYTAEWKDFLAGAGYTPQIYRTNRTDIWKSPNRLDIGAPGYFDESTTRQSRRRMADTASFGKRKLLKGSSGGGGSSGRSGGGSGYSSPTYRSRSGNYGYYGATAPIVRGRSRTSTSPTVGPLTVVTVRSRGPVYSSRTTTSRTGTAGDGTSSYTNTQCMAESGCEFVVNDPLVTDSFEKAVVNVPEELPTSGGFKFSVRAVVGYNLTSVKNVSMGFGYNAANQYVPLTRSTVTYHDYPSVFVVFATPDVNPAFYAGAVGIPISAIVMCCLSYSALAIKWDFCPSSRKCGNKYHAVDGHDSTGPPPPVSTVGPATSAAPVGQMMGAGASATGASAIPAPGYTQGPMVYPIAVGHPWQPINAASGTFSMIKMPFPPIPTGTIAGRPGGDATSTVVMEAPAHTNVLNVPNNDISTIAGLGRYPGLVAMDVSHNDLASLAGIHEAPYLYGLMADENNLKNLHGLVNLPNLRWLKASHNDITSLAGGANLPQLQYACFASNELATTEGIETGLATVTHLDLSNNALKNIRGCHMLQRLCGLDLSQNDLTDANELMGLVALPFLAFLDIRGNDLPAAGKQTLRDHFAAHKPACTLQS